MSENFQAKLKQLTNHQLGKMRDKLSGKKGGLKKLSFAKANNIAQASLREFEAGIMSNAKLEESLRDLYIKELSKCEGDPRSLSIYGDEHLPEVTFKPRSTSLDGNSN